MKREIEFRGKTAKGEWVYGLLDYFGKDKYCIRTYDEERNGGVGYQVDENTISQFTGVTDKNGKKIYEYDKVKCKGVETLGTVLFDGGGFGVEFDEPIAEDWTSTALYCLINEEGLAECEVIGNIFDKESDNDG